MVFDRRFGRGWGSGAGLAYGELTVLGLIPKGALTFRVRFLGDLPEYGFGCGSLGLSLAEHFFGKIQNPSRLWFTADFDRPIRFHLALLEVELVHQPPQRLGFFHRVQGLAVDVFDDLEGEARLFFHRANDARKQFPAQIPARCEATFPRQENDWRPPSRSPATRPGWAAVHQHVVKALQGMLEALLPEVPGVQERIRLRKRQRRRRHLEREVSVGDHRRQSLGLGEQTSPTVCPSKPSGSSPTARVAWA